MGSIYIRVLLISYILLIYILLITACEPSIVTDAELINPQNTDTTLQQQIIGKWTGNGEYCNNTLYNNFDQNYQFNAGNGIAYNSLFPDSTLDSIWFSYTIASDSLYITWDLDTIQYLSQYRISISGSELTLSIDSVFCPADSTYAELQSNFTKW